MFVSVVLSIQKDEFMDAFSAHYPVLNPLRRYLTKTITGGFVGYGISVKQFIEDTPYLDKYTYRYTVQRHDLFTKTGLPIAGTTEKVHTFAAFQSRQMALVTRFKTIGIEELNLGYSTGEDIVGANRSSSRSAAGNIYSIVTKSESMR